MGDLQNKYIDESYGSLLHTTEDTGLSGTTKSVIQDGKGTDTALELSTDKVNVNGDLQTGGTDRVTSTGELVNVSGNISQFTNDEGYLSAVPPTYLQTGDNVSELTNDSGYLTSATIPSNVMREGEDVSLLNNDAGYITGIPTDLVVDTLTADKVIIDTASGVVVSNPGEIGWNSTEGTIDIQLLNGVVLQSGQEMHIYGKAVGTISNGSVVQFAGVQGDHIVFKEAVQSEIADNPQYIIGVATQTLVNNQFGYITTVGNVRGLDTSGYLEGDILWYDSEGGIPGLLTKTKPTGQSVKYQMAVVERVNANEGMILVRPTHIKNMGELGDTNFTNLTDNEYVKFQSGEWVNTPLPAGLLQTEDGNALGGGRTNFTDGQGNKTGMFSWLEYGLNGIDNSYDTTKIPQWIISNDNWNTSTWPQPSGAISLSFGDFDEFKTYEITQNRFGGVLYKTYSPSQSHIFTGAAGNDGVIRINTFNSPNNSDNWFEAYNSNITSVSVDGSNTLVLDLRGGGQLSTALPGGGGGDTYDHQVGWTAGIGLNNSVSQNISYSSYQAYLNDVYFQPIYLSANNTYTKFKYYVNAADTDPGNFLSIGIYDSQIQTASTLFAGVGLPTNRLVVNTAVPISSTGYVEVDFPSPFTPAKSGLYWLGHVIESPTSTTLALRTFDAKTMSHSSVFPASVINENIDKENGSIYNFYSTPQYPVVNENSTDGIRLNNYSELVETITYPTTIGASLVGGAGIAIYTNS